MVSLFRQEQVDDDRRTCCLTSIGRTENEVILLVTDIKSHKNALVDFTDPPNAAGERLDEEALASSELDVNCGQEDEDQTGRTR